ncbi:MAG: translocation/assembly module TamB [Prevotella sp.]|nr:translocation/assembly module TamB [Bacteroides sp.]MCM1365877.1 translocation/assembly module TamB [Prevotella sp.]
MKVLKEIYNTIRSIVFSGILLVVALYVLIYISISLPYIQNYIKEVAEEEISKSLKTDIKIGRLNITPFSQVILYDVEIPCPDKSPCIEAKKIGAGISLWDLIIDRKIVITYAELLDLNAHISQQQKGEPLNIQFIIDAFKTKKEGQPPTKFDLKIRNVVIRRLSASFDKEWIAKDKNPNKMDFNHLEVHNLSLDVTLPRISNDEYIMDLRRLSLEEKSGFKLNKLTLKARLTPTQLIVNDLEIDLPGTSIRPNNQSFNFSTLKELGTSFIDGRHSIILSNNKVTLSDFAAFVPTLKHFNTPLLLSIDVTGTRRDINIKEVRVSSANNQLFLQLEGNALLPVNFKNSEFNLKKFRLEASAQEMSHILSNLSSLSPDIKNRLIALGMLSVNASARYRSSQTIFKGLIKSSIGNLNIDTELDILNKNNIAGKGKIITDGINLATVFPETELGKLIFNIDSEISINNKQFNGSALAKIDLVEYKGNSLTNILLDASKHGDNIIGNLTIDDPNVSVDANAELHLGTNLKTINTNIAINHFYPQNIGILPTSKLNSVEGNLDTNVSITGLDDIRGNVHGESFKIIDKTGKSFTLDNLEINADVDSQSGIRTLNIYSDYADVSLTGNYHISRIPDIFRSMLHKALPSIISQPKNIPSFQDENFDLCLLIYKNDNLTELLNLPIKLLTDIPIKANFNGDNGTANLLIDIPYLQQGKNKLISNTALKLNLNDPLSSAAVSLSTTLPNKNGDIHLNLAASAVNNLVATDIAWKYDREKSYNGNISLQGLLSKNSQTGQLNVDAKINPGVFHVNDATWNVAPASISYSDKLVNINNLHVSHDNQFVDINGTASASPLDTVKISLSDIDLDYIFETLNINYVTFGGSATGTVKACSAFSPKPMAFTDGLWVKNLTYNGAVLGNAELTSHWDNAEKEVTIRADIDTGQDKLTIVDGGVWVTRDSLSFDLDANKVNIKFLQPFMSAFASDVQGLASGKAKLFGTFSDIDLIGRLHADTISLKLDYTNTYYSGSDSVYLNPGHIIIPGFKLYDKFGNSAEFSGWLKHRYFHEPSFEFKLKEARHLLCYDTDAKINQDWYGTIFGNGSATVTGIPGFVSILVDMNTTSGSDFTFVINEAEATDQYRFLSFTDKRKEQQQKDKPDTIPDFIKAFQKRVESQSEAPSIFNLDIRATITPQTTVNLIMDPIAGDKIKARGEGAMQLGYSSDNDEMTIYGKYIVQEGSYNFSLQDLILKDFTIRPGSSVSFNGDPLQAILDITAAYRVNTNLSDLDPSFKNDRDLNRTNIPVEALLIVNGDINSPEIKFDIDLPTVNSDVVRKVKSIISTDDMMSRQVIYLLALNRFYSPDYTNSSSNGTGEFASVASSTLSSQISNVLGALSDKWTISPSFRTDKGDFSDMEVDVTIASSLLNNRLLFNGNFGYRDPNTSNTTFVGDFDIEYLLNKSGNFRLKAYNHFNDQNYYLKSALTTQGVGIVLRKDFDDAFSWIKRLLKKKSNNRKSSDDKKENRQKGQKEINKSSRQSLF